MRIFIFLQKYIIGFNPRLWLGHSRKFIELSLSDSCCVLRVIVQLEGEPSAQSEVLNALKSELGFHWGYLYILLHWAFLLLQWVPQSLLLKNISTVWGCYQHTLLLGWYSAGVDQSWFPSEMTLRIEVHQSRESCFLESEGPVCVFFIFIPCVFSWALTAERIESCHTVIKPILVECWSDVCPSVGFPHMIMELN